MALMSRPDPMPVEVMSELGELEEAVLLFTAELMGAFRKSVIYLSARHPGT